MTLLPNNCQLQQMSFNFRVYVGQSFELCTESWVTEILVIILRHSFTICVCCTYFTNVFSYWNSLSYRDTPARIQYN